MMKLQLRDKVALSGAQSEAARIAMEKPSFLDKVTVQIMKLARQKGFYSPFEDDMDLPGGKSAADLAVDIVEKALDGSYTWNSEKEPDFYNFCVSRAESILSNWLSKNVKMKTTSPLASENPQTGEMVESEFGSVSDPTDPYSILRDKDGGSLGDKFIEDLSLGLANDSHEQSIMMAVLDDRVCANRAYCMRKLNMAGNDYDAAVKRIRRRLPEFQKEWFKATGITAEEWEEAK